MSKWIFSYFAVWFGGSFWWVSSRFIDSEIVPKWFFAMFGTAVFCVVCAVAAFFLPEIRRTGARFTAVSAAILLCAASQAAYALLQWGGVCDSCGVFPACGSFDNPAGLASALAFSVPFGFYLAENSQGVLRKATWTAVVLVTAAVVASGSRSGMLAVCAVCLACLPTRWTSIRRPLALALLAVIAAASVFLYHYKKDSADGRLLIWQCTWELIKERPLAGHGPGGFQAHYMDAQADYFRAHPDSPYARLADDVKAPFNEYLGLLADFGLAGGLVEVGGLLREVVHAAMHVGIGVEVLVAHGVEHAKGLLGRGGVVEVDKRAAIDGAREDGEIGADFIKIEHNL